MFCLHTYSISLLLFPLQLCCGRRVRLSLIRCIQCSYPSTELSSDSNETWVRHMLKLCHIHMIASYPYWYVTRQDGGAGRNDLKEQSVYPWQKAYF